MYPVVIELDCENTVRIGQPKLPSRKERRKMRERLPNHEQKTRLAEEKLTLEIKTHWDLYFQASMRMTLAKHYLKG